MDADGLTFACATAHRGARRAARRRRARRVVGVGARRGVPDGRARLVRRRRRPARRARVRRRCSTRPASSTRTAPCSGRAPARASPARGPGRSSPWTASSTIPAERRRLHERTGADAVDMESGVLAAHRPPARLRAGDHRHAGRSRSGRSPQAVDAGRPAAAARASCSALAPAAPHDAGHSRDVRRALNGAREVPLTLNGPRPARRAALVLRRRRPRDRDRRAAARAARPAGLRPPPDRPQRPRRPPARGARRRLRRARGRDPAGRDLRPLGARRRAGGARELRAPRPPRRRRGLPARLEGARRGAALRRQRPPRRARRPRRPRRGDRDEGRAAGADRRRRVAGGRASAGRRTASRSP